MSLVEPDKRSARQVRSSLLTPGLPVSAAKAEWIAQAFYGLQARATMLSGEKDSNFYVQAEDNSEFLLKIISPGEDPQVTNFHTSALLHVALADPSIPVQRVVPTLDGQMDFRLPFDDEGERAVRLVTFARGVLQRNTENSAAQARAVGSILAQLQLALSDFGHHAADHELLWDLKHAAKLKGHLRVIPNQQKRDWLEGQLGRFESKTLPVLSELRTQIVHNDLNSDNVVVGPADPTLVTGVLDFGDMVRTAVVADVAVGAAYQLFAGDNPLHGALYFLEGFCSKRKLNSVELEILYDLIMTRMVTRLVISEWRASLFPENRKYILRNTPQTWAQFERLQALPRQTAAEGVRRACQA